MKKLLTMDFIMDWWLTKYHGITCEWLRENEPELIKEPFWYKKYAVTQEQHDEWYNWAIDYMSKYYRKSKKRTKVDFAFDYLNASPMVVEKMILVCSQCGGTNVQVHAWVDANTNKYIGDDMCDDGDTWCEDCQEHTGLVTEDYFNSNREEYKDEEA